MTRQNTSRATRTSPKRIAIQGRKVSNMPRADQNLPTVLVVDDEPAILRMLAEVLAMNGIAVLTAGGGAAGVKTYRQQQETISLVLLDVQMPPPCDGPQMLIELQQVNPLVRVAFMSGSTGRYSAAELLELGALRVFDKPFGSLPAFASDLKELIARTQPKRHAGSEGPP